MEAATPPTSTPTVCGRDAELAALGVQLDRVRSGDGAVVLVEGGDPVMQAEPDDPLLELLKRAHGSPFMVMELLSGLRDEELVRVDSGQAELVEDRLPRRVGDSMRERLRGMSEPAREAAIVAGSLGRRFSFGDLATMLDQPPSALLSPVEELMRFGVVIERDEQLAFRHDIIRDAVRASLPMSARRALDRQAADGYRARAFADHAGGLP